MEIKKQSAIRIQSLTFTVKSKLQSRLELSDFSLCGSCALKIAFLKWCSDFWEHFTVLITLAALVYTCVCTCTCVLEKKVLCLYNNAIQLAKLKVYKVTVLNHEKHIILYHGNYFKQMCSLC